MLLFTVNSAYNNHIGSIADYDPIKKQPVCDVKYTNNSESQNYNLGVCTFFLYNHITKTKPI